MFGWGVQLWGLCRTVSSILEEGSYSQPLTRKDMRLKKTFCTLVLIAIFKLEVGFINLVLWAGWVSFKVTKATSWVLLCQREKRVLAKNEMI